MNYNYRIYPTQDQQALMLEWLETCRHLYNRCLRDLKDWMHARKCSLDSCSMIREYIMSPDIPFPSYLEQKRQLTQWKKENPYYKEVHSQVTQDVVKRLHNTWSAFKARGFGFPRYKKYGRYQSFLFPQFKDNPIKGNIIKLPKIGEIGINCHRPIPEGFKVQPALVFRELQSRLKVLQRRASRKTKGSKNWEKAQLKVARLHHQISNTRKNFHFVISHLLCDQADMIFVEDINFKMTAKGFLGKQMLDGGFGQFRDLLSWVCWKRGKYFAQVDHRFTSQICPECGTHTGKKELKERVHICSECGYQTSRDHASGRVILNRGLNEVRLDESERKLSGNGVLSGLWLDKCRSRNTNSRGLEAYVCTAEQSA